MGVSLHLGEYLVASLVENAVFGHAEGSSDPVSYTHLTLPTNAEV